MPIILLLFALFIPRVVIALTWMFSSWFSVVPGWIAGIIGFLFFPYTLLWYTAVEQWFGSSWGVLQYVILIVAVIADLGLVGGSRYKREA